MDPEDLREVISAYQKCVAATVERFVGGASNDLVPNHQNPENPVPLLKEQIERMGKPHVQSGGG